jgi:hypothetical protein
MESIKGKDIFVLTTDWLDDYSTIRQGVDTFENEDEAKAALKDFDEEVGAWVKENSPDWNREGDGITFVEYGKEGNYFDSHAVGKITKCVVK